MSYISVIRKGRINKSIYDVIRSQMFYSTIKTHTNSLDSVVSEELIKIASNICEEKYDLSNFNDALCGLQSRLSELKGESLNIIKTSLNQIKLEGQLENTRLNILLQVLLLDPNTENSTIYKFIVTHSQSDLHFELLETFIYNLIESENLPAATILMHILFNNSKEFMISNELWSLYVSRVCDLSYLHGATMIYHELIDNHQHYDDTKSANINIENSHVPFLITNTVLEKLAWIFTHNKDSAKIQGILQYFKRFYSYIGHQETYKSLLFALVESYSNKGDISNAMKSFKYMSFRFQGNISLAKKENLDSILKISAFSNFRWRRDNIKNNVTSKLYLPQSLKTEKNLQEEIIADAANIELFNPSMERNVYTSPQTKHIGIIRGSFVTADLPYFKSLIKKNVNDIMNSSSNRLTQLINLNTSSHYKIQPFVISSLCELGYIREAFLVLLKLPSVYPNLASHILRDDECYIALFEACAEIELENQQFTKASVVDYCIEIKNYYLSISLKTNLSSKVCLSFLSAILKYNVISPDRIKAELNLILKKDAKVIIHLQEDDCQTLQLYGIDSPQIKQIKFNRKV